MQADAANLLKLRRLKTTMANSLFCATDAGGIGRGSGKLACGVVRRNFQKKTLDNRHGYAIITKRSAKVGADAAIAQLVERVIGNDEVGSSNLPSSSKKLWKHLLSEFFRFVVIFKNL